MKKLWLTRFLIYLPLLISTLLMLIGPTEGYWEDIALIPFVFLLMGYIVVEIITTVIEDDSTFYFWQSWRAKPVYSKYGTYYLIRIGEKIIVAESKYFFMYNISKKSGLGYISFSGETDKKFIDGISEHISTYINLSGEKTKSKKTFETWNGYLDKQVMRDKKLESLNVEQAKKVGI